FEQRMLYPSFADHQITDDLRQRVKAAFDPHCGANGAHFTRPIHVRLLQKQAV
ncbi:MAG: SAM-dependent methyltransferase, partial [Thiomonas sp. 14-64-326]